MRSPIRPTRNSPHGVERLGAIEGVERRPRADGSVSLAVRGLEFARTSGSTLLFGIDERHAAGSGQLPEIEALARGLARLRSAAAADRVNPLYLRHPEAWLESQVRSSPSRLDASIRDSPLYSQAPQFAAGSRGILDLLAVDYDGRLVVIEIKASEDIHLPLQALDYWMRVKWHLERGEFEGRGYFPGLPLRSDPPRLLLVAPALEFHPANETVLRYFSSEVHVERIGVGIQWRQELQVMFRAPSALLQPWPSQSFRQIRQALVNLNPAEVRAQADRPVRVGLVAASRESLGQMEQFFAPHHLSPERRAEAVQILIRGGGPSCDVQIYESSLLRPAKAFSFDPEAPEDCVRRIVRKREDLMLPLARRLDPFRKEVSHHVVRAVAKENALVLPGDGFAGRGPQPDFAALVRRRIRIGRGVPHHEPDPHGIPAGRGQRPFGGISRAEIGDRFHRHGRVRMASSGARGWSRKYPSAAG